MASGTVGYTDTRGNKDYTSIIASQIGKRLKEASDMASDERGYAEKQAEAGGTSLSEAGIGKGYFFKRALGSRFGGDRIARTRGRMGAQGAGKNPAASYKQRFRGGFDYNVTNQVLTDTAPLTSALATGLRGVESGLDEISSAIQRQDKTLSSLSRSQADMAKATMFNGYLFQMFATEQRRERERRSARKEERSIEGRGGFGTSGRRMINITPRGAGGVGGASVGIKDAINAGDITRRVTRGAFSTGAYKAGGATVKAGSTAVKTFKAGGNIRKFGQLTKNLDPFLGMSKGAVNMAKLMPGGSALKNSLGPLFQGVSKTTGNPRTFEKLAKTATVPGKINKIQKTLKNSKSAIVDLSQTLNRTGDATDIIEIGAKTPRKIKKAYSAAENIVTGGPDMIKAVTTSPELMNQIKNADKVSDGLSTAKTVAAAADAGAKPNFLRRFIFGTRPKGLVRGSALTRMLLKNPAGKMFLKKLPLIGALAGTIFAAQRLMEGDFLGAGLEFSSGLLGAVGASPLSLGLDGFLLARDFGAVPFFNGGITSRPTLGMMSEKGQKEGVFPLQGAEGRKTFKMFGEGALNARLDNESEDSKLQAMGHKTYYETMGGWTKFGEGLLSAFGGMKDTVADVFSDLNPFKGLKGREKKSNEGKNQWWDIMDVFPNPQVSNPSNSNELANLLNSSSAQTSMGGLFVSPTIINNYSTVAAGGDGGGSEEVGNGAFPYTFTAFNVDYSLASK